MRKEDEMPYKDKPKGFKRFKVTYTLTYECIEARTKEEALEVGKDLVHRDLNGNCILSTDDGFTVEEMKKHERQGNVR